MAFRFLVNHRHGQTDDSMQHFIGPIQECFGQAGQHKCALAAVASRCAETAVCSVQCMLFWRYLNANCTKTENTSFTK